MVVPWPFLDMVVSKIEFGPPNRYMSCRFLVQTLPLAHEAGTPVTAPKTFRPDPRPTQVKATSGLGLPLNKGTS